jgi:HlyD family secretion protein
MVRLRAFVDESDLGGLKLDQPVKITWDAIPDREWTGRTEQIPRQVLSRGSRSIGEVLCSVDNQKLELLPNVNVDVRILVQEKDNALAVPRATVRTEQGKHYVLVLDGDRLRRREVQLGMSNGTTYEIVSGVSEGDQVALSSNLNIHEGTVVHASETK